MELTSEQIDKKVAAKAKELQDFGNQLQIEVNRDQTALQNKVRNGQKRLDNLEGEIAALISLKQELYPPAPQPEKKVVPFPPPANKDEPGK